jgi:hypothetical protein
MHEKMQINVLIFIELEIKPRIIHRGDAEAQSGNLQRLCAIAVSLITDKVAIILA